MKRIASIAVLVCLGTSPAPARDTPHRASHDRCGATGFAKRNAASQGLAEPLRTTFTCQGELQDAAAAADGLHNLRFRWCENPFSHPSSRNPLRRFLAPVGGSQTGAQLRADRLARSGGGARANLISKGNQHLHHAVQ